MVFSKTLLLHRLSGAIRHKPEFADKNLGSISKFPKQFIVVRCSLPGPLRRGKTERCPEANERLEGTKPDVSPQIEHKCVSLTSFLVK